MAGGAAPATPGGNQQQQNPFAQNLMIRKLWVEGGGPLNPNIPPALDMWQALNPNLPSGVGPGSVITAQLRNVGMVKRLLVRITGTVTAPAAGNQTLAPYGLANLISNVIFTDLANNQRINTTGWHLTAVSSAKRRTVFGAAYMSDTPFGYGDIFGTVQQAPASIAQGTAANFQLMLEIPFAYSDRDLRGVIFADVTQATMQVALSLNQNMFVSSGADPTLAMYQSSTANLPTLSNVAVQIYQNYLDQGPRNQQNGAPILPQLDLGTAYMLNNTASVLPVANQDNATPFVNSRQFLSLLFFYDNAGTLNVGSDINSIAVQSANLTNILKVDPFTLAFMGRNIIGDDFPKGMYYLDFRHRPVDTTQYGNMQVVINPSNVGGNSAFFGFGWESMGYIGLVNQGGAIPSGA